MAKEVTVGVDGNEAFEQGKKGLIDGYNFLFGSDQRRTVLCEVRNNLGIDLSLWGYWALKPTSFESHLADTLPALIDGKSPSQIFSAGSGGADCRAVGIVSYILNFEGKVDMLPGHNGMAFMMFNLYFANPNKESNKIYCEIEYFQQDYQGYNACQAVLSASGDAITNRLKGKYHDYDGKEGQNIYSRSDYKPPIIGDTYTVTGQLKDLGLVSGHSFDQCANFVLSRESFTPANPFVW